MIFEEGLVHELEDCERVEAYDGYRGHAPEHMGCPACISKPKDQEKCNKEFVAGMRPAIEGRINGVS